MNIIIFCITFDCLMFIELRIFEYTDRLERIFCFSKIVLNTTLMCGCIFLIKIVFF